MRKKAILLLIAISLCVLLGCIKKESKDNSAVKMDTSGFKVWFDIHMTDNLIFIPNYLDDWYNVGDTYESAIDDWTDLQYSEAEKKFLQVEAAIEGADNQYYPDDVAFVKESLGLLYFDMANYKKAYDYLIDAYVIMESLYSEKNNIISAERFYPEAVEVALCHYYYEIGDYDRCLNEVQNIRDREERFNSDDADTAYLQLFVNCIINKIEANIYKDRAEYIKSQDLYAENYKLCSNYVKENSDATLGYILCLNTCECNGDLCSLFLSDKEYAKAADGYYDQALKICEKFNGSLKDQCKARILMKRGKFLANFSDKQELSQDSLNEAVSIERKLYETGKISPDIIQMYVMYAEVNGFVKWDLNEALLYYDKALNIAQDIYGSNHPYTAEVYESMGRFYGNRMKDDDKAIEYFEKSIDCYKNLLLEKNFKVAGIYLQLAGCYKIKGENEKSDEYLEKANSMYDALGIQMIKTKKEVTE